ncbi:MAG: PhnD/SsuA/transferrin family substrate-binding protein [Candidatus Thiodiazotropha sp.]
MNHFSWRKIILAIVFWPVVAMTADLHFAPLPMLEERALRGQFSPLLEHISYTQGTPVTWHYYPTYEEVIDALVRGDVNLAYLGPLPYIELTEQHDFFTPLARVREKDGTAAYECALTHFGAEEVPLQMLQHTRFALTQPLSTCGSFAVSVMLSRVGLALNTHGNRHDFTGGHDKAALAVLAGDADAAGLKAAIAKRYASLGLRVIETAGPYPGFAFIADTRTLDAGEIQKLRETLLEFTQDSNTESWLSRGMISASDDEYEQLRADWHQVKHIISTLK